MKKIIYLILAMGFVGTLSAQYTCPACTVNVTTNNQTVNGTAGVDVVCVTASVTNTTFNNLGTGDIVCVSPGVTWSMPSDLNYNGLVTYRIGPGANVTLPGGGSNGNLQIDNYGNLILTNSSGVNFIANGGSVMLINNYLGAVLNALGTANVTFGNGADFNNYGTMNFNNLETAESNSPLNDGTGVINVKRAFYLHSLGFTDLGKINITCEDTGNPAWNVFWISQAVNGCGLTIGDKGPFQVEFGPLSCSVVMGATVFNGPALINGYYETSGNFTIRKVVSGSGNIVVTNGISGTENDGALLGGINFYDVNTANGFGNTPAIMAPHGLDFNNGNPVDNFNIPATQPANPCLSVSCTSPMATFTQTVPTCTGTTANNNGIITFATATDVTNFGISTAGAATYNGPAYPATTFTAVGQNVSTNIPNTGGTYIIRVFNGSASCFSDVTVTVAAVSCVITCIPPVITVVPGTVCVGTSIDLNSLVTGNSPAGTLSFHATLANANAGTNPLINTVVSPLANATYYARSTINATCYSVGTLSVTVSMPPILTVNNGQVCAGGSINLATLVTSGGGGTLSYFTTLANAQNNTNALVSPVVSPVSATNYFVRSTNAAGCYTIQNVVVSLAGANCGTIQETGPN